MLVSPQVVEWASTPAQALLLADGVVWTRAAAEALELQQRAPRSRALRRLADAAALQLESVSAALRGQHGGRDAGSCSDGGGTSSINQQQQGPPLQARRSNQLTAGAHHDRDECPSPSHMMDATGAEVLLVHAGSQGARDAGQGCPEAGQGGARPISGQAAAAAVATAKGLAVAQRQAQLGSSTTQAWATARPATPDATDCGQPTPWASCRTNPQGTSKQLISQASPKSSAAKLTATSIHNSVTLTVQQRVGLQALLAAASCHKDVAAALVAADAQGTSSFDWGKQLRHYWQPDYQELQVGWAEPI